MLQGLRFPDVLCRPEPWSRNRDNTGGLASAVAVFTGSLPLPIPRSRHQASRVALWNGHPLIAPTQLHSSREVLGAVSQNPPALDVQNAAQFSIGGLLALESTVTSGRTFTP